MIENTETLKGGTGEYIEDIHPFVYKFDRFEITVNLSSDRRFVSISEVKINQDYASFIDKSTPMGHKDVIEYYKD